MGKAFVRFMQVIFFVLFLLIAVSPLEAQEKRAAIVSRIRLYLPDAELRRRLGEAKPFADYIRSLESELVSFWGENPQPAAKGVLVAVGVRPGRKSKIWCEAVEGGIQPEVLSKLEEKLGTVPPIEVNEAPIAFALDVQLHDAASDKFPKIPKVWSDTVKSSKRPLSVPDALFEVLWPE
jgi:hypothetical protein